MTLQAILQIEWGDGFTSPFIGPYPHMTAANKDATLLRKWLRAEGTEFTCVRVHILRPSEWARAVFDPENTIARIQPQPQPLPLPANDNQTNNDEHEANASDTDTDEHNRTGGVRT